MPQKLALINEGSFLMWNVSTRTEGTRERLPAARMADVTMWLCLDKGSKTLGKCIEMCCLLLLMFCVCVCVCVCSSTSSQF